MAKFSVAALLLAAVGSNAFAPNQNTPVRRFDPMQYSSIPEDGGFANIPPPKDMAYGEESRKMRRTVFTHDDWVKFRSPDRFFRNLSYFGASGIYKNVMNEVGACTVIATLVWAWNLVFHGYTDLSGVDHAALFQTANDMTAKLPLEPYTLASSSLGLLLGKHLVPNATTW